MMVAIYEEKVQSLRTTLLFTILAIFFLVVFAWRVSLSGLKAFPLVLLFFGLFFTFYIGNYRVLRIHISDQDLILRFGLIRWREELDNINEAVLDDSPKLVRYGGAGVHFAFVSGEYRAFFNFLDYPRVVIRLRTKKGPVQALVFTTRRPQAILQLLADRINPYEN